MVQSSKIPNRKDLGKKYKSKLPVFEKILSRLQDSLKRDLIKMGLHPTIKARVKTFESYYNKILRLLSNPESREGAFDIYDVLGVRVVCPFLGDLSIAEDQIKKKYVVIQRESKGSEYSFREFGYKSTHFLIKVPKKILDRFKAEAPLLCEIQLCTILQDAWSEVEHELVYKKNFSPFDEPMKRRLAALNANLSLSDTLFQEIRDYQRKLQLELDKRRTGFMLRVQQPSTVPSSTLKPDSWLSDRKRTEHQVPEGSASINKSVDDLLVDALAAHNTGQFKKAITIYSSILKRKFPEHIKSIIHIHRGMAYFSQSHYKKALTDFTISLKLGPENHRAFYYRALTHEVEQNYQDALKDFNKCIQINPYQFEAFYGRAQLYTRMKDYVKAMADCNWALTIEPSLSKAMQLKKNLHAHIKKSGLPE